MQAPGILPVLGRHGQGKAATAEAAAKGTTQAVRFRQQDEQQHVHGSTSSQPAETNTDMSEQRPPKAPKLCGPSAGSDGLAQTSLTASGAAALPARAVGSVLFVHFLP